MGQAQQKSCHHNQSVKLFWEPRSQVYPLTIATIVLCNNPLQNPVAKDIYGSIDHLGISASFCRSMSLGLLHGLSPSLNQKASCGKVMAEAQE